MARKERILIVADAGSTYNHDQLRDADIVIALGPEPTVLKCRHGLTDDVEVRLDPRIQIEAG